MLRNTDGIGLSHRIGYVYETNGLMASISPVFLPPNSSYFCFISPFISAFTRTPSTGLLMWIAAIKSVSFHHRHDVLSKRAKFGPKTIDGTAQLEKYASAPLGIAWALRAFLTELPEPLLTKRFGSSFMKTQLNPDPTARYRNMRILLKALPPVNHAVIRSVLELFRLVLHHRRKNKLTVSGFCAELGPILLGVEKLQPNGLPTQDALIAADVLKTLITQYQFLVGNTDEPAEYDSLPLFTKKSKHTLLTQHSRARGLLSRQRTLATVGSLSTTTAPPMRHANSQMSQPYSHHPQHVLPNGRHATISALPGSSHSPFSSSSSSTVPFGSSTLPPFYTSGMGSSTTSTTIVPSILPATLSPTSTGNSLNGSSSSISALHGSSAPALFAHLQQAPVSPTSSNDLASSLGATSALASSVPENSSALKDYAPVSPSSTQVPSTAPIFTAQSTQSTHSPASSLSNTASALAGVPANSSPPPHSQPGSQAVPFVPLALPSQQLPAVNLSTLASTSSENKEGLAKETRSSSLQQTKVNRSATVFSSSAPMQPTQHAHTYQNYSSDEEELISLTDGIMQKFLDQTVRTVLFEPQVRISFNYEAKIPTQLKRNYTLDKWSEMQRGFGGGNESSLRQGAWRPTLEDDIPSTMLTSRRRRDSTREREDSIMSAEDVMSSRTDRSDTRYRRNTTTDSGPENHKEHAHSHKDSKEKLDHKDRKDSIKESTSIRDSKDPKDSKEEQRSSSTILKEGNGDGGDSSSSNSSKRRSRRVSITGEDIEGAEAKYADRTGPAATVLPMRRTSVDSSFSDDVAGRRRVSSDQLSEIESYSLSSEPDSDTHASDDPGGKRKISKKSTSKREEQMERRASTSKVGTKSKITSSGKERPRRTTLSTEYKIEDLDLDDPNGHASTAAAPVPATTSTSATTTAAAEKPKTKAPRPRSKPPHVVMDSKTIMENAPSPPSGMPPPLNTSNLSAATSIPSPKEGTSTTS